MNPIVGWSLAVIGVALAYVQYGWQGVVLAVTLVVFWLLLQFSRTMRVMRQASAAPVGHVASAVMLQAKLRTGMRLLEVLPITGSLGRKLADEPETFAWSDAGGDRVVLEFEKGRCVRWRLERAPSDGAAPPAGQGPSN